MFVGETNNRCIQAKFVAKVLKNQAFVLASGFGNGV